MVLCSSRTGQAALQRLPPSTDSKVFGSKEAILKFPVPKNALQSEQSANNNNNNYDDADDNRSVSSSVSKRALSLLSSPRGRRGNRNSSPVRKRSQSPRRRQGRELRSSEGIPVWKITKTGKLQSRRLAFSFDRSSILVTTTKIKSIRGLFKAATGSSLIDVKKLDFIHVDRIQKGMHTSRFHRATGITCAAVEGADQAQASSSSTGRTNIHTAANSNSNNNNNTNANNSNLNLDELLHDKTTLSIIYEADGGRGYESLDLAIPDKDDYEDIVGSLQGLIRLYRTERNSNTRQLEMLHYHWIESIKRPLPPPSRDLMVVSLTDFLTLADRLDVLEGAGRSKLSALFKQHCEALKGHNNEHLTFSETARLLETARCLQNLKEDDPLEHLWRRMVESDPVPPVDVNKNDLSLHAHEVDFMKHAKGGPGESISTVAFLSFLRNHQKEFPTTLDEATALVNSLNRLHSPYGEELRSQLAAEGPIESPNQRTMVPDDRLAKSRFMDYITSDFNELLMEQPEMDMTRPLSHYFIATSHASFISIPTNQPGMSSWEDDGEKTALGSGPDVSSIYTALYRGVRCLETTVWDGGPNRSEPVVCLTEEGLEHAIRFQHCLDAIVFFLRTYPATFPILLKIENHCSTPVQAVLAQQIRETIGLTGLLFEPEFSLQDIAFVLPSPEEARGKVIILGKRPREMPEEQKLSPRDASAGARVMNDDYDATNDELDIAASPSLIRYFDDEEEKGEHEGVVVGFDASGPVYSMDIRAVPLSPQVLWEKAERERAIAEREASETMARTMDLEERSYRMEAEALKMSQKAGITVEQLRHQRQSKLEEAPTQETIPEEKSMKEDEGVEIHEVLTDIVEASHYEYTIAAHEAMEAAKRVQYLKRAYDEAKERLEAAKVEVTKSKDRVNYLVQESQKARLKAAANREHANVANLRLEKVRELLKSSEETSTSAETVVVTALTEAKISEKRAADAESRAARAFAAAAKDRARSDEETRREEELETQVTALLGECKNANLAAKAAREQLERTASALDRVKEQIGLMESSSNYKKQLESQKKPSTSRLEHRGSFAEKHAAKIAEREQLVQKMNQETEAMKNAELDKLRLHKKFEEVNQMLKLQTELASKMRKVADRSAHVAEELAEHADEEREAANLRHVARERAEANVENRGQYKLSLQTQYQEAQRASAEAFQLAEESRKHAERLEAELGEARDFDGLLQIVEEREWGFNEAKAQYEIELAEKQTKDAVMLKQRKLVEVSDDVRQSARRELKMEQDRAHATKIYFHEAVNAYNESAMLRKESIAARKLADEAAMTLKEKTRIARRALEYRNKMSLVVEIPPSLSAQTLLHSLKFFHWDKSMGLSNAHYHSVAFHALQRLVESNHDVNVRNTRKFTETHLFRVYPSRNDLEKNKKSNYDPVFPWSLGCQLVSMNYGSPDENLIVAEGMFRQNSNCGYVLRPSRLFGPVLEENIRRWTVKILGAYHLPKMASGRRHSGQHVRPIVRLSLHTGEAGILPFTFETRRSNRKETDPVLYTEDNICTFDVVNQWVAMASFTVWDTSGEKRSCIAGSAIPVSCFREGYRSIALYDAHNARPGPYRFASLLVHVSKAS